MIIYCFYTKPLWTKSITVLRKGAWGERQPLPTCWLADSNSRDIIPPKNDFVSLSQEVISHAVQAKQKSRFS